MSKRLFLIRHGKAATALSGMSDFTRTLTETGLADAQEMATRLEKQGLVPELLISSPAPRALSTATCFSKIWNIPVSSIKIDLSIYEANLRSLVSIVNNLEDSVKQAAIFGHNPGISELANYLLDDRGISMPTAGVVIIDFPLDAWNHIVAQSGTLKLVDYPKSTR
jgi:phosphohistidine phosphatase